jgi:hypothetical protein
MALEEERPCLESSASICDDGGSKHARQDEVIYR